MRLETGAKVAHANNGVGNGKEDEQDGDDGECGQRLSNSPVLFSLLVDSDKLVNKVGQSTQMQHNDDDHAGFVLATSEEGSRDEDDDGDGNSGNGNGEFRVVSVGDHNNELDDEAEEEEEIELQEGNENLWMISQ